MTALMLGLLLSLPANAGSLSSVTVPDSATVAGQSLVLNGMGLREKFWIDIYVGSLYLPSKTTDASKAINDDVAKRITMDFIYSEVTKEQLIETFQEGLAKQPNASAEVKAGMATLNTWMQDVHAGDKIVIDYVPGTGTTISMKGQAKGTIEGVDFMRSLLTIFIGDDPPTAAFKAGMMGKK